MKSIIIAVGRLKAEEAALVARYEKRLSNLKIITIPERSQSEQEWYAIDKAIDSKSKLVVLDERGKNLKSTQLAQWISAQELRPVTFVIGGAEGLSDELRARADLLLSFGAMTWPHQFIRVMLCEQLYRVQSIQAGHPYHRDN